MARRLVEVYQMGDPVEVFFAETAHEDATGEWRQGRVVGLQHPGVWVRTEDGAAWFVTNTRRIRPPRADAEVGD